MLFVPHTPGGILAKEMRKREDELNKFSKERIKIVQKVKNVPKSGAHYVKKVTIWWTTRRKELYPAILTILDIDGYVQHVKIRIFVRSMKGKPHDPPESEAGNISRLSSRKKRLVSFINTN